MMKKSFMKCEDKICYICNLNFAKDGHFLYTAIVT